MKGIIFNVVEEAVTDLGGPELWDDLLVAAGVDGAYTALGNYPDSDLAAIVTAAAEALSLPTSEILVIVGRAALPHLARHASEVVESVDSPLEFLTKVHEVIHIDVKKLYPNAQPPALAFRFVGEGMLELTYKSARHLGDLAEGLILGTGDLFGRPLAVHRHPGADGSVVFLVEDLDMGKESPSPTN